MRSTRLSERQRRFLRAIDDMPMYSKDPDVKLPLCRTNMPDWVWLSFNTENEAQRWIEALADRGLIVIEKDYFYRLTPEGSALLDKTP